MTFKFSHVSGFSLLSTLISSSIAISACGVALHFLALTLNTYLKIQQKFTTQQAALISRQMIGTDIYKMANQVQKCQAWQDSCKTSLPTEIHQLILQQQIKPKSDILILHGNGMQIIYYLRKSSLQKNRTTGFALYRDTITQNSVAIAENLQNFTIDQSQTHLKINLEFHSQQTMDFACKLPLY